VAMYLIAIIEKITSKIDANIRALYSASTIIPALYPTVAVATKRVSGIDRDSEISSNPFFFSSLIRVIEDSSLISIITTIILTRPQTAFGDAYESNNYKKQLIQNKL